MYGRARFGNRFRRACRLRRRNAIIVTDLGRCKFVRGRTKKLQSSRMKRAAVDPACASLKTDNELMSIGWKKLGGSKIRQTRLCQVVEDELKPGRRIGPARLAREIAEA